ncbi:protein-glutamate O-methyltransferase CheR [Geomonas subterranea]|uniref:Protein-glutamate O-methyltransferase CheR n=1 Tax=Geomonas subterranea TaxID=2847989 RepID=A0ABX8LCJ5_9BACT|nr:protein-glutamate O-methyltransferase CheR [Geomonas subterranea]QXE89387.1 protein-glutamate O-methyltransferase CheR [Geomonas subterranea]
MLSGITGSVEPDIAPDTFEVIGRILKARSGFTLEGYKDKCVKRRIHIRVRATHSPSPEAYGELLTRSTAEQDHLLRVLTIHVSHFFRNPPVFEKLGAEILPQLLEQRHQVRALSVGCAGGEEPYTLALLMKERFPEAVAAGRVTILGVDVDAAILDQAREALYHPDRLAEVPPQLLERHFTPEGGRYRLCPEVRGQVLFEHADLNHRQGWDPCDLILCRNVLIYFERERQETVLNGFADALSPGAYLVLGKAETLFGTARKRFKTICPVERIYRALN